MIERCNIISLLNNRTNVYHSAVLTCYNFDPIFFENIYMPTLRKLGVVNVIVIMDAGIYDSLLQDDNYHLHSIEGDDYTLVRYENANNGVFHPKMTLLFGGDEGALIIGSGNITFSGMSLNEEVWNAFNIKDNNSVNYPLLHTAWNYILSLAANFPALPNRQIDWIKENCEWLEKTAPEGPVKLPNGDTIWLLYNDNRTKILESVIELIGSAKVKEITVVSPFYDADGTAVKKLKETFNPKTIKCVLDIERQSAPYSLLNRSAGIEFLKYDDYVNSLHAKIYEFQTNEGTWFLSGSANASGMAMGLYGKNYNDEFCVLIHHPKSYNYIVQLGLEKNIQRISKDELKTIKEPTQTKDNTKQRQTTILYSEYDEDGLHLSFTETGIRGELVILSNKLKKVFTVKTNTKKEVTIAVPEGIENSMNLVVLRQNGEDISNRSLIIKESLVEKCNPDPRRRELSRLLTEDGLSEHFAEILNYVQFEDDDVIIKSGKGSRQSQKKDNDLGPTVDREDFDDLKDKSKISISLNSGVRILDYLSKIFFKDTEEVTRNENLETADAENDTYYEEVIIDVNQTEIIERSICRYLKKMNKSLEVRINQPENTIDGAPEVSYLPKLICKPGLNSCSSFAIALRSIVFLMSNNKDSITKKEDIKGYLIHNANLFFSLFHNLYPDGQTNVDKKCRELLSDLIPLFLLSLSLFHFSKDEISMLILTLLNCFDYSRATGKSFRDMYSDYITLLDKTEAVKESTIEIIQRVATVYLKTPDIPITEFSYFLDTIFIYRKDYGFLMADDIYNDKDHWTYTYYHPRFDYQEDNGDYTKGASRSKFKGFKITDFFK